MNGDVLSKRVVVPDHNTACNRGVVIEILRGGTDNSPIADKVAITHRHVIGQNRMGLDDAIIPKGNSLLDNSIGTDLRISSKPDFGTDKC